MKRLPILAAAVIIVFLAGMSSYLMARVAYLEGKVSLLEDNMVMRERYEDLQVKYGLMQERTTSACMGVVAKLLDNLGVKDDSVVRYQLELGVGGDGDSDKRR